MHEPITQLQRALGDLESDIRYLQPDKMRWTYIRKELIEKLDWCKELARRVRDESSDDEVITNGDKKLKEMLGN